jgi:predicted DNA-binding transcriptional regulator YafY
MKADRLLSVLMLLQARGRATERELAERLEVSQRTIHRDLESLSASGVPVLALRGATGGWELAKGWRTQVPGLNAPELQALLLAQPRALGHPRLAAAAQSAMDKLLASLPGAMQQQAAAMRERLHVDPRGWWDVGEDFSALQTVQDAVANQRSLTFEYVKADGKASARTVDPLGLVAKGSTWYLVAQTAAGMRTFRVSRITNATVLAMGFERPTRFDLAAYWAKSIAEIERRQGSFPVVLGLTPDAVQRLRTHVRIGACDRRATGSEVPSGWEVIRADFDDESQARFVVMGLSTRAVVIGPAEFRRHIADEVRAMALRTGDSAAD